MLIFWLQDAVFSISLPSKLNGAMTNLQLAQRPANFTVHGSFPDPIEHQHLHLSHLEFSLSANMKTAFMTETLLFSQCIFYNVLGQKK